MNDTPEPRKAIRLLVANHKVQANALDELAEVGARRQEALRQARKDLSQIRQLARKAIGAGATMSDVAQAANVSRPTLYKLLDHQPKVRRVKKP